MKFGLKKKNQKGFTLIEMLVVLTIVGIISVAVSRGMSGTSETAVATSIMSTVNKMSENWVAINLASRTKPTIDNAGASPYLGADSDLYSGITGGDKVLALLAASEFVDQGTTAQNDDEVSIIGSGTVLLDAATNAQTEAKVRAFNRAGTRPLAQSLTDFGAQGFGIEDYMIEQIESDGKVMEVTLDTVGPEVCTVLMEKYPNKVYVGVNTGVDQCGSATDIIVKSYL